MPKGIITQARACFYIFIYRYGLSYRLSFQKDTIGFRSPMLFPNIVLCVSLVYFPHFFLSCLLTKSEAHS